MEKLTDVELSSVVLEEGKSRSWEKDNPCSVIVQVRIRGTISLLVDGFPNIALGVYRGITLCHSPGCIFWT